MKYKIGTRDFLIRAKQRLDENLPESLFYAALELRLGIEARLKIYMEIIEDLSKKKQKGWRIADLDKNLENTFKSGNKLVEIMIIDNTTKNPLTVFYYTPVSKDLIKKGDKLGELLHAKKIFLSQKDDWPSKTKSFLEDIYRELEKANRGTLLGPPLFNPKLGRFDLSIEVYEGYNPQEKLDRIGGMGKQIILQIDYPNEYPE